jgi:hypothetical protein
MKIAYEPHPVSPDRKAELRAQGFKIMDAVFAPEGYVDAVQAETETEAETTAPVKRGRPRKAD